MLSPQQIEKINKTISNRVFNYNGILINGVDTNANIDFKIEFLGYKKMISVGEYYNYLKVGVTIIGLNDGLSKLILSDINYLGNNHYQFFKNSLYHFYSSLESYISSVIKLFDNEDSLITICDIKLDLRKKPLTMNEGRMSRVALKTVNEGRMSRVALKTVVRDIIYKVKEGKKGLFYLPKEDESYEFTNLPFSFDVELTLKTSGNIKDYQMNGYYSSEEDVVEIIIIFNPNRFKEYVYNLIGELNEVLAHELEHGHQNYRGEFEDRSDADTKDSLVYYTQEHEIPAQYTGFKRLAKLRKVPFSSVVNDWFRTHKDIHGLTDDEEKIVIDKILNFKR
jgi:hypothetical protein